MADYVGPTTIRCPEQCEVPAGYSLSMVPVPRHNWGDVVVCPQDGCERAWLIVGRPEPSGIEVGDG